MTIEQLRSARRAEPFQPFTVCLADGRQLPIPHPEFVMVLPGSPRTFVVGSTDETYKVVDLLLVTSLDFNGRPAE